MKYAALAAGILLGLLFVSSAVVVLFHLAAVPDIPKDSAVGQFMAATGPTGFMTFVKVFELLGGLLVMIPRTRNLGLLILGPIIVNILAFHQFIAGDGIFQATLIAIITLPLFLLWVERARWKALLS
ncbi:MAG: hypothetical protein IAE77_30035 [Prosthecobacter sp.]|jgi:putative oxidoreductase|uniref:hypothetical protein n=1 Tax=Prosthecobacter sp. TaxID=1965333 RepID=UPI0019DA81AE|nr:hypothetical protein [Prosthecobacter sp.]MBE2287735.1 hypothetical protein [Prosthecobacter sp.]